VAGEGESGQVPNLIKEVASDLQRPKPINVHFGFAPAENRGSFWIWEYKDAGNSAGCGIAQDDSPEACVDWRTGCRSSSLPDPRCTGRGAPGMPVSFSSRSLQGARR
jgi:hypothetical protein